MADRLEILAVRGMGEITPGTDLAQAIVEAAPWLRTGDILVVTSKIVSKAEGRLVDVAVAGPERETAREAILRAETARPVARRGNTRIVATHHGFVMASAGIDASNVERSRLVLLPKDPDASARALRGALRDRFGRTVAVIVSDTMGRPWRNGLTDVALGAAGIAPIRDHRGESDPYGNDLHITQMATIDELCGAAELVKGKCDQVPVAVIRGYLGHRDGHDGRATDGDGPGAVVLVRDAEHDLFTLGTAEARAEGLRGAADLADVAGFGDPASPDSHWADSHCADPHWADLRCPDPGGADPAAVAHIVRSVPTGPQTVLTLVDPATHLDQAGAGGAGLPPHTLHVLVCGLAGGRPDAGHYLRLGEDVHRVRCALAAAGLATIWRPAPEDGDISANPPGASDRTSATGSGRGTVRAGLLAIGVPATADPS